MKKGDKVKIKKNGVKGIVDGVSDGFGGFIAGVICEDGVYDLIPIDELEVEPACESYPPTLPISPAIKNWLSTLPRKD